MQEVGVIPLPRWRHAQGEAIVGVVTGVDAATPALVAEGRVGDHVIKSLETAVVCEELRGASVFPGRISAVGQLCKYMFIRASDAVAESFSCPYSETFAPASSATLSSSDPEPQVGS